MARGNMTAEPPGASPNVLVIVSDQHHPGMLGAAGHPLVRTPHIDKLAEKGTLFTNAYCSSPLCCPSRMSFMTACHPSEIDCVHNDDYLRSDAPTFAHSFVGAGYETVLCGRMHFNGPDQRHGFQRRLINDVIPTALERLGLRNVLGALSDTTGPHVRSLQKAGPGYTGYIHYDALVADAAVDWLRERGGDSEARPFMMTVGFIQPHAPFVALPEDYDLYDELISVDDLPDYDEESLHPEIRRLRQLAGLEGESAPTPEQQRRARVAYLAMCTSLDREVGRVLTALEESGLGEDTIVVYTSDHGEQLGEHGMWWKHTFYESSVGIPMIVAGPGIPQGERNDRNVSLMDLGPTLLDLCDAPAIPGASGSSFATLFGGQEDTWPDLVFAENLWGDQRLNRMVRRGPWKLNDYVGMAPSLYNLVDDPDEMHDRAGDPECAAILNELSQELRRLPDREAVMQRRAHRAAARSWIVSAFAEGDLQEPDRNWSGAELAALNHWGQN